MKFSAQQLEYMLLIVSTPINVGNVHMDLFVRSSGEQELVGDMNLSVVNGALHARIHNIDISKRSAGASGATKSMQHYQNKKKRISVL